MGRQIPLLVEKIIVGAGILAVVWTNSAIAQSDSLTRASVYKLERTVQLLLQKNGRRITPANKGDVLVPKDELRTKTQSKAELLFNEGSLARVGSNAEFFFTPGIRRYQLPGGGFRAETILQLKNGTALVMAPPGSSTTTVELGGDRDSGGDIRIEANLSPSPQSDILPTTDKSTTFAFYYNNQTKTGQIFNLTNNPIQISDRNRTQTISLQAGQTVTVKDGAIGEVQTFDLRKFYATSQLAAGLGPGQEALVEQESPTVQKTINAARKETLAALEVQAKWIEGLCTLNARGGSSTLTTNCVTTNSDDPNDKFEEHREVVDPERQRPRPQ